MNTLKLVAKNLFGRKGRFIFTLLGISIGMASFVALLSLGGSMRSEVTRQAQAMGANFIIMPEDICVFNLIAIVTGETISESMHYEVFESIAEIEGIEVIPHLTQQAAVRDMRSVVVGILPEETKIFREWDIAEGEYFSHQNENAAIIGLFIFGLIRSSISAASSIGSPKISRYISVKSKPDNTSKVSIYRSAVASPVRSRGLDSTH